MGSSVASESRSIVTEFTTPAANRTVSAVTAFEKKKWREPASGPRHF